MPQVLLTPQIIANEALAILKNNLVMQELVHVDYSQEFVKVGDTITVRKPATFIAKDFATEISAQDIEEGSVTVKIDRFKDVSVKLTSKEQTLDLKDFSAQVIAPAMVALSQQVDADLINFAVGEAGSSVSAASATPTNLADVANIAKILDKKKAPMIERRLVLSPDHKYRYALTTNLSAVNYAGTNETLRDALLGKLYTLETYMDQNAPTSSAAVSGTATGNVTVASSSTAGKVDFTAGSGATATFKAGDGFIYKGILYVLSADATLTSSAKADLVVVPAFPEGVAATIVPVVRNSASVAFHKNAFAFVNRQLELPMGAARAAIASGEGISVRVVYGYDQKTKTDTISFDLIYGIATLNKDLAVRLVDTF